MARCSRLRQGDVTIIVPPVAGSTSRRKNFSMECITKLKDITHIAVVCFCPSQFYWNLWLKAVPHVVPQDLAHPPEDESVSRLQHVQPNMDISVPQIIGTRCCLVSFLAKSCHCFLLLMALQVCFFRTQLTTNSGSMLKPDCVWRAIVDDGKKRAKTELGACGGFKSMIVIFRLMVKSLLQKRWLRWSHLFDMSLEHKGIYIY